MKSFRPIYILPVSTTPRALKRKRISAVEISNDDTNIVKYMKGLLNEKIAEMNKANQDIDKQLADAESALRREINKKLQEIGTQFNSSVKSLTGRLIDSGLWSTGEIITVSSNDFLPHSSDQLDKDWGYRHHLGVVPQRAIQFMPKGPFTYGAAEYVEWPFLRKGARPWTDTYVYFRPSSEVGGFTDTDACTIEVLLIP